MIRVTRSAIIDAPIARVWEVLRDFNSHWAWHPAVGESHIENGEPADQVGCVRNFHLKDGNHIREQLLGLSDRDHISTYCILDATLPMRHYVATVQLKPVTDGDRTFWHWQSTFDVPRGRAKEFAELVGKGVYEGGFDGLRAHLRRGAAPAAISPAVAAQAAVPAQAVVATAFGGPEVLDYRSQPAAAPRSGEVRIRQSAIGVNFIDVYVRRGLYRMIDPPAAIGMEAAGTVIDVGPNVAHLLPGDRVAYACPPPGAYATVRTLAADQVVPLPQDVGDETAAALMLKGMTAEYLLHRTHRLRQGQNVLVHAAAGGVGLLLCQWARAIGGRVIGTVSTEEKARLARANGCEFPIITGNYRFAREVMDITGGRGADVIYDGLGQGAATENLDALAVTGHWVCYGQASGPHAAMPDLGTKSGTLSRPVLFHYTAERHVLNEMAERVFAALRAGTIRVEIRHRYPLAAAAEAHRDLEARRTVGSIVLIA
ncbi:MAG: zinc-binding dehydrogenase [Alphaproteobacteria bacterium]|nr:zinc-binding dehydrogenase [Alphaproteobacteria bacterium]